MATGNEELIDQYVDRTGVANDTKFFLEQLNQVFEALKKLSEIKVGLGNAKTAFTSGPLAKDAAAEIDKMTKANNTLVEATNKLVTANSKVSQSFQDNIVKQLEYKNRLAEISVGLKDLNKDQELLYKTKGNDAAKKEIEDRIKAYAIEQAQIKLLSKELEKVIQLQLKGDTVPSGKNQGSSGTSEPSLNVDEIRKLTIVQDDNIRSQKELLDISAQVKINQKLVSDEISDLNAAYKNGSISQSEYNKRLSELIEKQTALSVAGGSVNQALKNAEKAFQSAAGSTNELRSELTQLLQQFDSLTPEAKVSDAGLLMKKRIDDLTIAVSEQEQITGRFQRNVGNYQGSAKIIVDALKKVEEEITKLQEKQKALQQRTVVQGFGKNIGDNETVAQLQQTTAQIGFLTKQAQSLNTITSNPQFLNIAGKVGDSNTELRFFIKQLNELETAGLKNSKVYADVQARLAKLTDQVQDTRQEIKALSSDSRTFDLLAGSITFAADAFQTAVGASVLFGASEEDAAAATRTLIAVQTVSNGVKSIANELTTKGTAANKAFAFVQGLVTTSLDKSATAATRAKAALGLLGLAATIIGALVIAFAQYNKKLSETEAAQKRINDALEESKSAYTDAITQVNSLKQNIALAKDGFISKEGVVKQYNETIGKTTGEVKSLDEAEQALTKNAEAYIKFTLLKAAANIALEKAAEKAFEAELARNKKQEEFLTTTDKAVSFGAGNVSAPGFVPGLQEKATQTQIAFDKAQSEKRKNAQIKNIKEEQTSFQKIAENFQKDAANISKEFKFDFFQDGPDTDKDNKKVADAAQKRIDDEKKAALELFKSRQQRIIEENKKTIGEDILITKVRIESLQRIAVAENNIITAQAAYDLSQKGLVKDAKIKIEEEYAEAVKKINTDLSNSTINIQVSINEKIKQTIETQKTELNEISDRLNAEQFKKEKEQIENIAENTRQRIDIIEISGNKELTALTNQFNKRKITKEQFEKESLNIERKLLLEGLEIQIDNNSKILIATIDNEDKRNELLALKESVRLDNTKKSINDRLNAELDAQEEILKASGISGQALIDAEKKIAEARLKIAQSSKKSKRDEDLDEIIDDLNKIKNTYLDVADVISGALNAISTRQKNLIQEEIDLLDEKTAKEIEAVNQTIANKEDAANKIAIIEARAAAKKQILERQQRVIDQRKAQFDKANAIAQIIINGAIAVVSALKESIFQAVVVGALAAAQLAIAIATPIPKFKEGKSANSDYEGPAVVGDGGRSELIQREDGSMEVTPDKPTLTWIGKDDIIHPDAEAALKQSAKNNDDFKKGTITKEKYDQENNRIDANVIKNSLLSQIKEYEILSEHIIDKQSSKKLFSGLKEELSKIDVSNTTNDTTKSNEIITTFLTKANDYYRQITSTFSNAITQKPMVPKFAFTINKDIIFPDPEMALRMSMNTSDRALANSNTTVTPVIDFEPLTNALGKKFDRLTTTIKNKTETHITTEGPLKSYIKRNGDSWTNYLNRNL